MGDSPSSTLTGRPHSLRSAEARASGASLRSAPAPLREPHLPPVVASAWSSLPVRDLWRPWPARNSPVIVC